MNCANHPDMAVSAYCQNCGKPLCTQCVRSVAGVVYCEPCLAARLQAGVPFGGTPRPGTGTGAPAGGWSAVPNAGVGAAPFVSATPYAATTGGMGLGANPVWAGLLGTIPGVGAMYNGQFVKALAHVLVLIVLIGLTDHFPLVGLLIALWVVYQIFDAIQTAVARRSGLPLPDPFGLNDLGVRLGMAPAASPVYSTPPPVGAAPGGSGVTSSAGSSAAAGPAQAAGSSFAASQPPPASASQADYDAWVQRVATEKALRDAGIPVGQPSGQPYSQPYAQPGYTPVTPPPPVIYGGRSEPIGAIVLIIVGTLFLLSTLGYLRLYWIGHSWPVLIIFIGAWLLFSRLRGGRQGGGL